MNGTEKAIIIIATLITVCYLAVLLILKIDSVIFGSVMAILGGLATKLISLRQASKKRK